MIHDWILNPVFWAALGIALITVDVVLTGFSLFLLALGVAALIMASGLQLQFWLLTVPIIDDWKTVLYVFAALSLLAVLLIRFVFQTRLKTPDINEY